MLCYREQAQSYVYDPSRVDSKRGLKRSWTGSQKDQPAAADSPGAKLTAADKGKFVLTNEQQTNNSELYHVLCNSILVSPMQANLAGARPRTARRQQRPRLVPPRARAASASPSTRLSWKSDLKMKS